MNIVLPYFAVSQVHKRQLRLIGSLLDVSAIRRSDRTQKNQSCKHCFPPCGTSRPVQPLVARLRNKGRKLHNTFNQTRISETAPDSENDNSYCSHVST